jgi:hypothetical protein
MIIFFKSFPSWAKSSLGTWKKWATRDTGIILMKHSALSANRMRFPMSSLLRSHNIITELNQLGFKSTKAKSLLRKAKYGSIDIGKLNVDAVVVDEAHNFNAIIEKANTRVGTPSDKRIGQPLNKQGGSSYRSPSVVDNVFEFSFKNNQKLLSGGFNFMSLMNYIKDKSRWKATSLLPKDRTDNIILLTATPFTDNNFQMLSLYFSMNKQLSAQMGVDNAYEFFSTYVSEVWKLDINERGGTSLFPKIDKYFNNRALSNYIKTFADFKVSDAVIEKKRPIKYIISSLPSSVPSSKEGADVRSLVDVNDIQKKMLKNLSEYVVGRNVNQFGFTNEDVAKAKKKIVSSARKSYKYNPKTKEKEQEIEEQLEKFSKVGKNIDYEQVYDLQESILDLIEELSSVSDGKNPYIEEYNDILIEATRIAEEEDEDSEDDSSTETDADSVLESGGLSDAQMENNRARFARMKNEDLAISPYLCTADREGELGNPYLDEKYGGLTAKSFVEASPKLLYTAKCILELQLHHKNTNTKASGSVIYCNRVKFVYGGVQYNMFDLIGEYLVDQCKSKKSKYYGLIKEGETDWLMGSITSRGGTGNTYISSRKSIQDDFNSGKIKVLFGTDTIREGINLQKNSATMFVLQSSYSPVTIMQLQGRIWRQGNAFTNCFIVNVLAKRTVDSFIYSKLDNKIRSVQEMLGSDVYDVSATQFEIDANENKLAIIQDPTKLAELQWVTERTKLDKESLKIASIIEALEKAQNDYVVDKERVNDFIPILNKIGKKLDEVEEERVKQKIKNKENPLRKQNAWEEHLKNLSDAKRKKLQKDQVAFMKARKDFKNFKYLTDAEVEELVGTESYPIEFNFTEVTAKTNFAIIEKSAQEVLEKAERMANNFRYSITGAQAVVKDVNAQKDIKDRKEKYLVEAKKRITEGKIEDLTKPDEIIFKLLTTIEVELANEKTSFASSRWYDWQSVQFGVYMRQFTADGNIGATISAFDTFVKDAPPLKKGKQNGIDEIDKLVEIQQAKKEEVDKILRDPDSAIEQLKKDFAKKIEAREKEKSSSLDSLVNDFKKVFPLIKRR